MLESWTRTCWNWPSEPVAESSSLRRPYITTCPPSTGGGEPASRTRCAPWWERWRARRWRPRHNLPERGPVLGAARAREREPPPLGPDGGPVGRPRRPLLGPVRAIVGRVRDPRVAGGDAA